MADGIWVFFFLFFPLFHPKSVIGSLAAVTHFGRPIFKWRIVEHGLDMHGRWCSYFSQPPAWFHSFSLCFNCFLLVAIISQNLHFNPFKSDKVIFFLTKKKVIYIITKARYRGYPLQRPQKLWLKWRLLTWTNGVTWLSIVTFSEVIASLSFISPASSQVPFSLKKRIVTGTFGDSINFFSSFAASFSFIKIYATILL